MPIIGYIPFKIVVDSLMFLSGYRTDSSWNSYADVLKIAVREGTALKILDVIGGASGDMLLNPNVADIRPQLRPNQFGFIVEYAPDGDSTVWTELSAGASDTIITDADNDGGTDTITLNTVICHAQVVQSDGTTIRVVTDPIEDTDILRLTVPDVGDIDVENLRVKVTYTAPTT